jgi:hypothetical protein
MAKPNYRSSEHLGRTNEPEAKHEISNISIFRVSRLGFRI